MLDARDRTDAIARATRDDRAGGYSYLCAFPGGGRVRDRVDRHDRRRPRGAGAHEPRPGPVGGRGGDPAVGGEPVRLARARQLGPAAAPTVEGLASVLADHDAAGDAICAHPHPRDGEEGSTILFAIICEPETRTMWVAPGHACTGTFERFAVAER